MNGAMPIVATWEEQQHERTDNVRRATT